MREALARNRVLTYVRTLAEALPFSMDGAARLRIERRELDEADVGDVPCRSAPNRPVRVAAGAEILHKGASREIHHAVGPVLDGAVLRPVRGSDLEIAVIAPSVPVVALDVGHERR